LLSSRESVTSAHAQIIISGRSEFVGKSE
jgi:hypothetical protein